MAQDMPRVLFMDCAPFMGGAQESLWTLVTECHRRGVHVALVCGNGELEKRADNYNIPSERIAVTHWRKSPRGLAAFLLERRNVKGILADAVAAFQPDIIVLNTVRMALLFPGLSENCVIHDRDVRVPWFLPRLLARRCPNVIAVSKTVAEKWRRAGASNLAVIHNMFDVEALCAEAEAVQNSRMKAAEPTVTLVADFVPWKNARDFIAAVSSVRSAAPNLRAVIKGRVRQAEGPACLNSLKEDVRRAKLEDVVDLDSRQESALPAMARADVVVSTATDEPFGRTAIEALALGKPFVAYDSGGFSEILRGCPAVTLVRPGDVNALAGAICQWLTENRCRQIADNARQFAHSFDISSIMPIFIEYFSNIVRTLNP